MLNATTPVSESLRLLRISSLLLGIVLYFRSAIFAAALLLMNFVSDQELLTCDVRVDLLAAFLTDPD